MLKHIFTLNLFIFLSYYGSSQDTLVHLNGSKMVVLQAVFEKSLVKYISYGDMNYKIQTIAYDSLATYKLKSGTIYKYGYSTVEKSEFSNLSNEEKNALAISDAGYFYKNYKKPRTTTTLVSIFLSPVAGLVPAIEFTSYDPKVNTLGIPYNKAEEDPVYLNAYMKEARHIRSQKVWKGYKTGAFIFLPALLTFGLIIGSAVHNGSGNGIGGMLSGI